MRHKHLQMPTPFNSSKDSKKRKGKKNMSVQKGEDETTKRLNAGHV